MDESESVAGAEGTHYDDDDTRLAGKAEKEKQGEREDARNDDYVSCARRTSLVFRAGVLFVTWTSSRDLRAPKKKKIKEVSALGDQFGHGRRWRAVVGSRRPGGEQLGGSQPAEGRWRWLARWVSLVVGAGPPGAGEGGRGMGIGGSERVQGQRKGSGRGLQAGPM